MKSCVYCKRRYKIGSEISFHRFPKDFEERKVWLENMETTNWTPKTYDSLCSLHFDDKCFDKHFNRTTLKPGSIPTVFEGTSTFASSPRPSTSTSLLRPSSSTSSPRPSSSTSSPRPSASTSLPSPLTAKSANVGTTSAKRKSFCDANIIQLSDKSKRDQEQLTDHDYDVSSTPKKPAIRSNISRILVENDQNQTSSQSISGCDAPNQDSSSCQYAEPASWKACRICLAMDVKLIHIKSFKLEQAYEDLTGISLLEEDKLPQKLCVECVHRLMNCSRFRLKSLRANSLMLEVIEKQDRLTVPNLKSINRSNNQLSSPLSPKHFQVNHYDAYIKYEDESEPILDDDDSSTCNVDNKSDNDIFLTEEITDKNDGFNDNGIDDDGTADNGVRVTDVIYDKDDIFEKECVLSGKDNYFSDDSLPSEKCKVKEMGKRNEKVTNPVKAVKRVKLLKDPTEPNIRRRRKPFLSEDLNESFTITNLTFEEQIAEMMKRQESSNYKNSVFKCTACFKGFSEEDAYNNHWTRHTDRCGEYVCEICKKHFKQLYALRKHIKALHTQRFSCKQCTYYTTNKISATRHELWHKGTKYRCPHCPDEFVKFTTYMGHIRIKHPSDFVCELCGYSFVSAKGIEQHKNLKHRLDNAQVPEDGPFCDLCNVRFVSIEAHKTHLVARHSIGTHLPTSRGKKSKASNTPMKCRATGPIPCEQCGIQLKGLRAYHVHFQQMHPDKNRTKYLMKSPYMCEVCGRMFQSYAHLKDHTWVHTGERPFKCDSCGKSFKMKQYLFTHKKVHSQVRASYVCEVCGKQFSDYSNRRRHMSTHTGLKLFQCEMCGKVFKRASETRAHIKYVHLKKPWPKRTRGKRRPDVKQGQIPQDQDMDREARQRPHVRANRSHARGT